MWITTMNHGCPITWLMDYMADGSHGCFITWLIYHMADLQFQRVCA